MCGLGQLDAKLLGLELGYMYHELGESQRETGQVPEAIESYRQSLHLKEKAGADDVSLGKTQYSMGECLAGGNKWDAAIEAFSKARDLEEKSEADDDNHKVPQEILEHAGAGAAGQRQRGRGQGRGREGQLDLGADGA